MVSLSFCLLNNRASTCFLKWFLKLVPTFLTCAIHAETSVTTENKIIKKIQSCTFIILVPHGLAPKISVLDKVSGVVHNYSDHPNRARDTKLILQYFENQWGVHILAKLFFKFKKIYFQQNQFIKWILVKFRYQKM